MERLKKLDYLRGLAAFGIMLYHYNMWVFGNFSSETLFGRIGIYGVSVFYVLSGLTLFMVYQKKINSKNELADFFKKRIFRIFPLLWLAILGTILLKRDIPDFLELSLNITGLFGFIDWDSYVALGSWSIGNELVFYIFFPLFLFLLRRSKVAFIFISIIIATIYMYFAFEILSPDETLANQWNNYVNPINQLFLFLGGFLIGALFKEVKVSETLCVLILLVGVGLFIWFPVKSSDQISLVSGIGRIIFTVSCFLICLSFFKSSLKVHTIFDKPLSLLGETSYSIYLLHPLVFAIVHKVFGLFLKVGILFPGPIKIIVSAIITIVGSNYVYQYFEKYFMKIGRRKKETLKAIPLEPKQTTSYL